MRVIVTYYDDAASQLKQQMFLHVHAIVEQKRATQPESFELRFGPKPSHAGIVCKQVVKIEVVPDVI